jgi:hypothetical protein
MTNKVLKRPYLYLVFRNYNLKGNQKNIPAKTNGVSLPGK